MIMLLVIFVRAPEYMFKELQLNIYEVLKLTRLFIVNEDLLLAICFQSSAIDQVIKISSHLHAFSLSTSVYSSVLHTLTHRESFQELHDYPQKITFLTSLKLGILIIYLSSVTNAHLETYQKKKAP